MQKIRKAIIPAAGFGTRFLPATKAMPKEMLPMLISRQSNILQKKFWKAVSTRS